MFDRAVILAGGLGTRLQAYSKGLPKPLVPIGDSPILEIIICQLVQCGFKHITLAVNYKADIIREYFGDGRAWDVHIDYSVETEALGTMGPLTLIKDLPQQFLVMNGDVLNDLDFRQFIAFHQSQEVLFSIASFKRLFKLEFGFLDISHQRLVGFREKPTFDYDVSMGIYCVDREVLQYIPPGKHFGLDELMLTLLNNQIPVGTFEHSGTWLDIGNVEDYESAKKTLLVMKQDQVVCQ